MTMEVRTTTDWGKIAKTGLAYGVGLMLGNVLSQILFIVLSPEPYGFLGQGARLLIGILVVMLITGLGGAIGGFLGGWTLPVIGKSKGKYGYAWRSAISVAVIYGTLLLLAVFAISSLTVRDASFMPVAPFMQVYFLVGFIAGALIGLLLGTTTVGWRRSGSVVLASAAGFGLGGAVLGASIWAYLNTAPAGGIYKGEYFYLLLGLFAFGFLGGSAIGIAYNRLARKSADQEPKPLRPWIRYGSYILLALFALWLVLQLRPIFAFLADYLTPRSALQTETIAADSIGTHWREASPAGDGSAKVTALDLSSGMPGNMALVWTENASGAENVFLRSALEDSAGEVVWGPPVKVSNSATRSHAPSASVDIKGDAHIVWLEGADRVAHYSRCSEGECTDPVPLADGAVSCSSETPNTDTATTDIAARSDGLVMAVWSSSEGGLVYHVLPDGGQGCVPLPQGVSINSFSLASQSPTEFLLAFDDLQDGVWMTKYTNAGWDSSAIELGSGARPNLLVTKNGTEFVAWCSGDGGVEYWSEGQVKTLSHLSCQDSPSMAIDGDGRIHVAWQSDQVEDVLSNIRQQDVLYETIFDGKSWSEPMIVAQIDSPADQAMVNDSAGDLHLAWTGIDPPIHYAMQHEYACDPGLLSDAEAELYRVAKQGGYRPEDDVIPFCQNEYETMLFTPSVDPAFSDEEPTVNGGYDGHAELLQRAQYEALFTTMAYSEAVNQDSPGAVLARSVVDLYEKVKANPEAYPRGMTVRLLLGNSPTLNFELLEADGGLWYVLKDLQEAGLEKMVDPDIGWRVEVGNFAGRFPYSHAKILIIDGETVAASGFNHEYKPLPKDHPSGLGLGDTDTALVINGPVAQYSREVYDQLWTGAITRYCPDMSAGETEMRLTCEDSRGIPDHVPEVMRYAPMDDDAVAFSMFRNRVYDESDQQLLAAFNAAEDSIDVAQAQFSSELICNLNHFFEVCDFDQALPYMEALMDAAERGVKVRILLTPYPSQNIENIIAMEIFNKEAVERGLARNVEIRMYDDLLHSKSTLIDGKLLIVGSQNLHWGAFGPGNGLSEYNLAIDDPAAAEQYQRFYDYMWERAPSRQLPFDVRNQD